MINTCSRRKWLKSWSLFLAKILCAILIKIKRVVKYRFAKDRSLCDVTAVKSLMLTALLLTDAVQSAG